MININRNNYEEIYIDFLDGNLSPSEQEQLFLFLDKNPDLKEETELHDQELVFEAEGVVFDKKHQLKKDKLLSGNALSNFNELCIAYMEDDLSDSEAREFASFLKESKKHAAEYELFHSTRLVADESIVFPNKSVLRKKTFKLRTSYYLLSAAASVMVLMALYLFLPKQVVEVSKQPVAKMEPDVRKEIDQQNSVSTTQKMIVDKIEPINNNKIDYNDELYKVERNLNNHTLNKQTKVLTHAEAPLEKLAPLQIGLAAKNDNPPGQLAKATIYTMDVVRNEPEEEAMSIAGFLASVFNEKILKKEKKERIELFDIAQAGVKGINKLTGSKMTLERKYNENGIPDKTEFASKLIAFSTPIKKD